MSGEEAWRLKALNDRPVQAGGRYVLYWMIAARRTAFNFGLERAASWAARLARPLLILEPLRVDYPWASPRFHAFILQGMLDNQRALAGRPAGYYPYVETAPGQGRDLLAALAGEACLVVTDRFPCFFLPRMTAAAAERIKVRLEAVDSCGLLPLARPGREFARAYDFRRYLQKHLPPFLADPPEEDPLSALRSADHAKTPREILAREILERWPPASQALLAADPQSLAALPLDQEVGQVELAGGQAAARRALEEFIETGLDRYETAARHPAAGATSRLSPYLHFGHLSAQEVFWAVARREGWNPERLSSQTKGSREGWWGMSPSAEAFLDQLVTWRELAYNFCFHRSDYDRYASLPPWALATLEEHAKDQRPYLYTLPQFDRAETHDRLWNAAQRQLVREGLIHNYLRMLWGKKILEWSPSPGQGLKVMIELNNRYALDGRDPNSYSGIFWVLGRFDRAWGPERPVLGKVRFMSSANTIRKLKLGDYLDRYGP